MKKYSPCYQCKERTPFGECHNTCEKYKEYDFDNQLRRLSSQIDKDYVDYKVDNARKRRKKKNEKNSG